MAAKATLELKSKSGGEGIRQLADRTQPGGTKVGFVAGLGKYPGSDITISENAAYQEFGTKLKNKVHIPERPFLRTTIREESPTYEAISKELMGQMLNGKITGQQAVGVLAEKAVSDVKAKIDAISDPANAQSTIDQKGSSSPLQDTGLMRQSVSWETAER